MSEIVTIKNDGAALYYGEGALNQISTLYTTGYNICVQSSQLNNESTEEDIKEKLQSLVTEFTELLNIIEEKKLNNKQWCLDGMDKMNEQSVRF